MADVSISLPASGVSSDGRSLPGGDVQQVVAIGNGSTADVAGVTAAGALLVQGHQGAATTLNVTTSSSSTGAIAADNYNVAMISIHGTHSGINLTWETSDDGGTTWYPCMAQRDDMGLTGTSSGVIAANASLSWTMTVGAATDIRVRSTAWTSGTGVVTVTLQSMPFETIVSAFAQPGQTVTGTITTQNLVPAGVATANSAVEIDLNGMCALGVQVTGTYTGALSLQGTVDGTTWVTLATGAPGFRMDTGAVIQTIVSAAQGLFQFNVAGLVKARITGLAAMTGTATVTLRPVPATGYIGSLGNAVLATGSNSIGNIGTVSTVTTVTGATTTPAAATTTAATLNSAATTNATSVKATAGNLYSVTASNINAAARYLKLYNKASAPTVGTDVPVLTIPIPATGVVNIAFGTQGFRFSAGIAFALTTGNADSDTAAVAASEIKVMLAYI